MKPILLCIAVFLATMSLASPPKKGKLVGHVDIGPLSPVERVGQKVKVPPEMYKHYFVMVTQMGPHNSQMKSHLIRVIANLKLSSSGDFSSDLEAGEYQVGVSSAQRSMRIPATQTVMVSSGKTTRLNLHVDTGIR